MVMCVGTSSVEVFNPITMYLCCVLIYLVNKSEWFEVTALLCDSLRLIVYICVFVCVPTECWRRIDQINALTTANVPLMQVLRGFVQLIYQRF